VAYGKDTMATETCEVLLYGQMQEGLRYEIIKSSSVSGAQCYKELVLLPKTRKNELLDLKSLKGHVQESKQPNPFCYNMYPKLIGAKLIH